MIDPARPGALAVLVPPSLTLIEAGLAVMNALAVIRVRLLGLVVCWAGVAINGAALPWLGSRWTREKMGSSAGPPMAPAQWAGAGLLLVVPVWPSEQARPQGRFAATLR